MSLAIESYILLSLKSGGLKFIAHEYGGWGVEGSSRPCGEMASVLVFITEWKIIPPLSNLKQQSFSYLLWYQLVRNLESAHMGSSGLEFLMWL